MKTKFACLALASSLLFAVHASAAAKQDPAPPPQAAAGQHHHGPAPAPTNLQVLPKNLTGEQVHEIMHKWAAQLGTECSTCHAADTSSAGANGRPHLNFALDTKPEKATARLMLKMTETINTEYVGKIDSSGAGVSCGTCHRGHLSPEPFVAPKDEDHDHDHDHAAPPAGK